MLLSRAGNLGTLGLYNAGTGPVPITYYASWLGALGTMSPNTNINFVSYNSVCDTDGNMYVCGQWNPSNQRFWGGSVLTGTWQSNGLLAKLDKNGSVAWQQMLGSPTDYVTFGSVQLHNGYLYVTGAQQLSTQYMVVAKYTINGSLVWQKKVSSSTTNFATSTNSKGVIKLDSSDNIYIMSDTCITKLDSSGTFVWARQLSTSSFGACLDFTIGSTGDLYITMFVQVSSQQRLQVLKLTSSGSISWQKTIDFAPSVVADDYPYSIICDSSDNVYITGIINSLNPTPTVRHPGAVVKFNSSGTYLGYLLLINTSGGHSISLNSMAIDNLTNTLYVSGSDSTTGVIAIMDTNLVLSLVHKYSPIGSSNPSALNISDGKLYFTGTNTGLPVTYIVGDFPLTATPPGVATSWTITRPTGTTVSLTYTSTSNIVSYTSVPTIGTGSSTATVITATVAAGTLVDQTAYSNPPIYTISSYKTSL